MGITFSLYADENDRTAVWQENQNLQLDSTGHYSALLGASSDEGLPLQVFSADGAHWLGVRPDGQAEQPRILLVSVAYALKAADTDMLGGKPASAFALADSQYSSVQPAAGAPVGSAASPPVLQTLTRSSGLAPLGLSPATACASITSDGTATVNQISKFTSACNIENSAIFESAGNVGIGNTSPAANLDVSGTSIIRGSLTAMGGAIFSPTGAATSAQGFVSNPLDLEAAAFNSTLSESVNYLFQWQAEPAGNDSANTGATLNLLYGVPGDISETGLSIAKSGIITFVAGQTFPGASGTVTSVSTGAGLTGGPITKTGTISIPAGGVTNNLLANPSVTVQAGSGLSGGGTVALGGTVTLTNAAPSSGGTVTSIATGTGLTGGPITKTGTISIPAGGITNGLLADSSIKVVAGSGLSGGGTVALGGTVTLTNAAPSSGGTVTSIATGTGLTGGPITNTGTISIPAGGITNSLLADSSIKVVAGSGLSGGGTVALGGTVTLTSNIAGATDGIAYFSSPTSLTSTAAPIDGQFLIGSTGKAPVLGTLTAGQNITIANDPGSITISATGASPTLQFLVTGGGRTGAAQGAIQNVNQLWGFLLPYNVTTTLITYDVTTLDNTANDYDIGVYNAAGTLVVDMGPTPGTTFANTDAFHTLHWTQGATSLEPGIYYIAFTTNCSTACAQIAAAPTNVSFAINVSAGTSTGGALPSTLTPPVAAWGTGNQPTIVIH
jgi:hypothetical protein